MSQSVLDGSTRILQRIPLAAKLYVWLPAVIVFLLVFQRPAAADTIYTYIGDDFSIFGQPVNTGGIPNPFSTEDHLFVSFTIAGPPLVCITSCSIAATDLCIGVQFPNGPSHGCGFNVLGSLQTDSSGKIVAWSFFGCNVPPSDSGCEDELIGTTSGFGKGNGDFVEVGNFFAMGSAGTWFRNVQSPVPEPTTLATLASGLVLLAGVARRRWK